MIVPEIDIDPVTRIEGHHALTLDVEDGVVEDAHAKATMFRGFERIVMERDPRDAPTILQRICGVCHNDHRLASLLALEDAAGVTVPPAGKLLRNVLGALQYTYDHAVWAYALTGPDYCDALHDTGLVRFDPLESQGVKEAVEAQRRLHQAMAVVGGKSPHVMTPVPGGISLEGDVKTVSKLVSMIRDVKRWAFGVGIGTSVVETAADLAPAVIDDVTAKLEAGEPIVPPADMPNGLYDLVSLVVVMAEMGVADLGTWESPTMVAYGTFRDPASGEKYLPGGVYRDGSFESFDEQNVGEDIAHSWYESDAGGEYVGDSRTRDLVPNYAEEEGYSWGKAPRYQGNPAEVGPLARLVALGHERGWELGDPIALREQLAGGRTASNALARNIARIQEFVLLVDYLEETLLELKEGIGELAYEEFETPDEATGIGLREAPRGALGHWLEIEDGLIENYQVIAPTTWNVSPRDGEGTMGPMEQALVGTTIEDLNDPWNAVRVVHSFDLCLACTVHVSDGDAETTVDVDAHGMGNLAGNTGITIREEDD